MVSAPSNRQCLELLGSKFLISNDERRTEILEKVSETSDITPAILDALASICAARKGDVIAVSAEILQDRIVLRVAGNKDVSEKVGEHLLEAWRLLRIFKTTPRDSEGKPEHKAESRSEMELCEHLYRFFIHRVCKRVRRHGEKTVAAFRKWDKHHSRRWEGFDDTLDSLTAINSLMKANSDSLDSSIPGICLLLDDIYDHVISTLNNITDSDTLAEMPWKGLRKILSLHKDVKLLSQIPRSPVRRKYLTKELQVIRLDQHHLSVPLEMPTAAEDLYDHFFQTKTETPETRTQIIDALNIWRKNAFSGVTSIKTVVHAECIMLLEIRKQLPSATGVYIGVSKLSCFACHHFIKAFNAATFEEGQGFGTKGSHGKFYPKWGDPCSLRWTEADERSKPAVQHRFGKAIEEILKQALTVAGHSQMASGSTTATERSDRGVRRDRGVVAKARGEHDFLSDKASDRQSM